jgi:hypothetical protein
MQDIELARRCYETTQEAKVIEIIGGYFEP